MLTDDELAGVVDLFGALTRAELLEALSELAYRRGEDLEDPEAAIDDALESFALVAFDPAASASGEGSEPEAADVEGAPDDAETLLAAGPAAFPEVPEGGEDLPHILDVGTRQVDREAVGRAAEERLRSATARAVADGDAERAATLLDVTYDLEAWAPVELADVRDRLDDARDGTD